MFIDSIEFFVSSGNGGAGSTSFRREKHVIHGGPDGGDGGKGGDVFFKVDNNTHTLSHFKGKRHLKAQNGQPGSGRKMYGKKGDDLEIIVPLGTQILNADTGEVLFDLTKKNEKVLFLQGGLGGLGNLHFKNSVNQKPTYAQPGRSGETVNVKLELKLIADVGLVGFPNVGKSTLISVVSNAKPEIANYEFTTLTPKLGVVDLGDFNSFVMADIPGIIEGASDGKGLGLEFLKHIERTKILLLVVDLANYRPLEEQYEILRKELRSFSDELSKKTFAIGLSRFDAADDNVNLRIEKFLQYLGLDSNSENIEFLFKKDDLIKISYIDSSKPCFVLPFSSLSKYNLSNLVNNLYNILEEIKE